MTKEKDEYTVAGWHLKKEVTVGQIVTVISLAISFVWWASTVETRLGVLQQEDKRIEQKTDIVLKGMADRFDRNQAAVAAAFEKIDRGLLRIENKLDKKQDK